MNASVDMITAGLKMVAALGVVLALILFLLYGLRKMSGQRLGAVGAKRIQVLESHYMGVKKSISLVKVPGKVLVLGLSADRITLLDRLNIDDVDLSVVPNESKPFAPFLSERLKKISQKKKGKEES